MAERSASRLGSHSQGKVPQGNVPQGEKSEHKEPGGKELTKQVSAAPIRIVFCITELDPGGAERALTQLVTGMDRSEWDPVVISLGQRGVFADVLESQGIPVISLNARGLFSFPRVLWQLTRHLNRLRPAIVQTFLFHANIVGRIAAKLAGVKVVVSGLRVAERRSDWFGRIDRWTNGLVTTNVCVSQGVADFSAQRVRLDPRKLVVIPNSVDADRFSAAKPADLTSLGIPPGQRVLISIGRLDRQKGFDVLIDAVAQVKTWPEDFIFLLVGDGPEAAVLQHQVDQAGLTNQIRFAGRREDIPHLLAASFALILPSRWEGMPNVVLEAMAAGLPVVATRVEGISELVQEGLTGLVVAPEDARGLGVAIQQLLFSPDFARTAGVESQRAVNNGFTAQAVVESYANLYRKSL